ncbi:MULTISPECIES: SMP-30/gluconolactonase/LRE family protein [unclassified Acidocella]|uniref:SMP-30/gluconolactonase/LRE family protein n=1 Tax=unclassified Acidocella TaxID=2648610 RepID=UPI00028E3D9A|nr:MULTISPECIES: SMP-30/gluconolactonase/LRE family protein [unclassified Acidocella]EKM99860.1 SMP-30/gluconolaconase/LRE domain-containing protein [Acidocella sp. MX-AZ02]WBO58486.1 SMP-30/gluconolactonase/LRE family protein [Acidocella sp. MX-AZ03]
MSFFPPPYRTETTVFTRLPDRFRASRRTAWSDANRMGQEVDSFLEGPSFDRAGWLYVTDIPFGRIFRISPDGEWELVTEYDGWPNGLKIHQDGRLFVTDYKQGLVVVDPATGAVTPLLETVGSEGFKGVNDLIFAANGDLYFTDQGQTGLQDPTGRVYRLSATGALTCLIGTIPSPNGIVIGPNMDYLLVAVTRANQIWRIPLLASGLVAKVGIFSHLHGGPGGPDGLALDEEGNLLVAHTGFGTVWRLSPRAEPLERIVSSAGYSTTNLAFGGSARRELFITESQTGTILKAGLAVPGQRLYSHS